MEPAAVSLDGRVQRVWEGLVEPGGRDRIGGLLREGPGFPAEVLAELVEGRNGQETGGSGGRLGLGREHPRQRRVEADEERPEAFAGEASGLLDGEHRLAGPGTSDDARPADAAEHVERPDLALGQLDDLALALDELVAKQGMELDRRGDEVAEDRDTLLARWSRARPRAAPFAAPEFEGLFQPRPQVGRRAVTRQEPWLIEDEIRVHVRAQRREAESTTGTRQVNGRQGDTLTRGRSQAGLPLGQFEQLLDEVVPAGRCLLERRPIELPLAGPPPTEVVAVGSRRP